MVAEHCLRQYLQQQGISDMLVHSAGIIAAPQDPRTKTLEVLQSLGIDVSHHIQTKITPTVVDAYDLIIAMAIDHQQFVKEHFGRNIPLFNEIAIGEHTSVLDIKEAFPDAEKESEDENRHIVWTIHYIHDHIPAVYDYIRTHHML